jgi:FSR family fosmidomycin resistance protein-like MFS transporter
MTQAVEIGPATRRAGDTRLIATVSAAHFISHYYLLALPPLFAFVRADYAVSYTEIGLALTVLNVVSALLQTPAGFLVDRHNPRHVLIGGVLLGAVGLAIAAMVNSYWVLIAMFGVLGLGNTAYHPADYALLSRHVSPGRMSQAYSIHTFSGLLGGAAAPGSLLFLQSQFGWRGAFVGAALLGGAAAVALVLLPDTPERPVPKPRADAPVVDTGWRLLLSPPILVNFVLFALLAMTNFGLQNFSVVALGALHGTATVTANAALSSHLILSAAGVLLGGWIATRTRRHSIVAALGMSVTAVVCTVLGLVDPGGLGVILLMSLAGVGMGVLLPSRDMIVREVTPPGAYGKVFGFVTNGFNIAGVLSPLICGALLDHGEPRAVFILLAVCSLLAVATVVSMPRRRTA